MLRRRVVTGIVCLAIFVVVSLLIVSIVNQRVNQNRVYSLNNLRELGHFAILAAKPEDLKVMGAKAAVEKDRLIKLGAPAAIPAGTVINLSLTPTQRLSWVVTAIPYLNQQRQDSLTLQHGIIMTQPWDSTANKPLSESVIRSLIPSAINFEARPGEAALTYYIGIGGVGATDAAMLPITDPKAGCFRYDATTPFDAIGDGLHQSILFAETSFQVSPWMQGGLGTVRTIGEEKTLLGPTAPFGGIHRGYSCFGYADGAASVLTNRISPDVFRSMGTINGQDGLVGE